MPTGFGRGIKLCYVQNLWAKIVLSDLTHSRYTSETNECPLKKWQCQKESSPPTTIFQKTC